MHIQQEQRTALTQRIDPKLIVANSILQLSNMELVQSIEAELLENPALETQEDTGCDGGCIDPNACPYCAARERARQEDEQETLDSGDHQMEYDNEFDGGAMPDAEEDYDFAGNLESETTLREHLTSLLHTAVPSEDYEVGEYLINSLDERGWLIESAFHIACELDVPEAQVCRLLEIIQSFDPPGVGAQDLRQCLLLQLRALREEAAPGLQKCNEHATRMIEEQFDHVCSSRQSKIARALKIPPDDVKRALEYIRARLNPFPASQFRLPWMSRPANNKTVVRPDVIIRRAEYGYEIDVPQTEGFALNINAQYREAYQRIKENADAGSAEANSHFIEYVERAERFIQNLAQRRQTLRQISRCVVECQAGFLETGSRQFLRALTRTHVAHLLEVHESTVSRATANKFVQLPNQEVVGFEIFFKGALSVKDAIAALIQEEDTADPLSDQQIVDLLQERGITVARRTVVKYRDQAKILSSTRRRR